MSPVFWLQEGGGLWVVGPWGAAGPSGEQGVDNGVGQSGWIRQGHPLNWSEQGASGCSLPPKTPETSHRVGSSDREGPCRAVSIRTQPLPSLGTAGEAGRGSSASLWVTGRRGR